MVAGKLEALSEAAGPYAEGVGDVDVPAAGGAVTSYGGSGRDIQYPSVICQCRWHGRQRQTRQSEHHGTNHYSTRAQGGLSAWCLVSGLYSGLPELLLIFKSYRYGFVHAQILYKAVASKDSNPPQFHCPIRCYGRRPPAGAG